MRKHQLLALLLVFAMIASIVSATFIFAEAEASTDPVTMTFTKKDAKVGNYDLIYYTGGQTLSADSSTGMNFRWVPVIVCDANGKVIRIARNLTGEKNVEVPEGGFAIAAHFGPNDDTNLDVKAYIDDLFTAAGKSTLSNEIADVTVDWQIVLNDDISGATLYRGPAPGPVVYDFLAAMKDTETEDYTLKVNKGGSVSITLKRDATNNPIFIVDKYDCKVDLNKTTYLAVDFTTTGTEADFRIHYTRTGNDANSPADNYFTGAKGNTANVVRSGDTYVVWNVSAYSAGKRLADGHEFLDFAVTTGKAGDVITINTYALVSDADAMVVGTPLVDRDDYNRVVYDFLGAMDNTDTDDYTLKVNKGGSVSITLKKDAPVKIVDKYDCKVDLNKTTYLAVDFTTTGDEADFLIHYTRTGNDASSPADNYFTGAKGNTANVVRSGDTYVVWNVSAYSAGKRLEDGHEFLDFAVTTGKAGDVITINTYALVNDADAMVVGTPLVYRDAQSTNLALNKPYTNANSEPLNGHGNYTAKLTDGNAASVLSYDANWFAFYNNPPAETNAPDKVGTVIIDLEQFATLESVRVNTFVGSESGIIPPKSVKVEVSADGVTYRQIGDTLRPAVDTTTKVVWLEFAANNATARYVKVTVELAGVFAFINEIEAIGVPVDVENVALGKPYTHSELYPTTDTASYPDTNNVELTDGVIAPDDAGYGNAAFMGFNSNADYAAGYSWIKVDLGDIYTLNELVLYVGGGASNAAAGIKPPKSTTFLVSTNDVNFTEVGTVSPVEDETTTNSVKVSLKPETAVTARYVLIRNVHASNWMFVSEFEAYGVPADYIPREPAGEIVIDGKLGDTGYEDAEWVEHNLWQNKGAPEPAELTGKFTTRMDDKYVSVAVQIDNTVAPNILEDYAAKVAGGLAANGAQTSTYVQTGATTFRIWLRGDANERYLIDVQYLGEELGWVATRAIFPTGSSLTWTDLDVTAAATYEGGVLTIEIAFLKEQFGIDENIAVFVTYSDNKLDDGVNASAYQALHICNPGTTTDDNGYIGGGYSGNVTHPYTFYTEEAIAVIEIRMPRVATGNVTIDGVLDDDTYEDKDASPWNDHTLWQNKNAPRPADMSGKFTARADGENISVAIEIKGAIEPSILPSYLEKIANAGKLTANGAQADLYVQTGATTFRIWLRGDANERYLIDVQYLGETIGWVATRAIFPTGSSLTWNDLKVIVAANYTDGVLTMEVTFPKEQFGITGDFAMFITYSDNLTDETYTEPVYQCLHLCSVDTSVNDDGLITDYSGNVTHPYVVFTADSAAVEKIDYSDALNMANLNYTNLGAATVRADLALDESCYTPESWAPFAEALAEALEALNARARAITTQDEIDALADKLLAAYEALELKDADYTAVDKALADVKDLDENNYTEDSWKALQDAIANVTRDLKADEQDKVDEMAKAINDAINALKLKDADYEAVDFLLQVVDKLVPENYTEDSWKALQDAIAKVVRDLKMDQQADVDAMAQAIAQAILDLVKATPAPDTSSEETSSEESSDTSSDESSDTSSEESSDASSDESSDTSSEEAPSTSSEAPSTSSDAPASSDSPETGDSGIVIFALLAVLSLAGAIVAVRVRH